MKDNGKPLAWPISESGNFHNEATMTQTLEQAIGKLRDHADEYAAKKARVAKLTELIVKHNYDRHWPDSRHVMVGFHLTYVVADFGEDVDEIELESAATEVAERFAERELMPGYEKFGVTDGVVCMEFRFEVI